MRGFERRDREGEERTILYTVSLGCRLLGYQRPKQGAAQTSVDPVDHLHLHRVRADSSTMHRSFEYRLLSYFILLLDRHYESQRPPTTRHCLCLSVLAILLAPLPSRRSAQHPSAWIPIYRSSPFFPTASPLPPPFKLSAVAST